MTTVSKEPGAKMEAFVLIDACASDGKWICEYYSNRLHGDTTNQWVRLEGVTPPLPTEGAHFTIRPIAYGAGEAAFDELTVEPLEVRPIYGLASSVYRDTAWEGTVRFDADLAIDTDRMKLEDLSASFSFATPTGTTRRVKAMRFNQLQAQIDVPVTDLPMGTNPVSFELRDKKGKIIDSETLLFTRTKACPPWKVYFDRHNRLIVDGKPFFPLGFYHAMINKEVLDIYCKGPFNCVLPYMYTTREQLDECSARGLKVIHCLITYKMGDPMCPVKGFETAADADRALTVRMNEVKDHPSTLAWYLNDEVPISQRPWLIERYRFARAMDPEHPTYGVFCQADQIRGYRASCDVIGSDPYPIGRRPLEYVSDETRTVVSGVGRGPVWQVPQAFDWRWFGKRGDGYRMPTKAEARNMMWQCVANGSNGIIFYCYHHMWSDQPRAAFDKDWKNFCEIAEETVPLFPILLADPACASSATDDVSCRAWTKDDKTYLLVVNENEKAKNAEICLPGTFTNLTYMALDRLSPSLTQNRLKVAIPPLGVTLVRLEK
jgi:hypothetical protein